MDFYYEIIDLIDSKKEGDYWDFKESWYNNNADMLHDIICMANNLVSRDSYIIFGIEDKTFKIKSIKGDTKRKNQQNIIDFLKSKKFVGGIRPDIELKTIIIKTNEIDVLIIKNSYNTPFFLLEDYRDKNELVKKFTIYTRVGDTNTPKDNIADINQIEFLWKKRFLLTESPIKRIFNSLKEKSNWEERYVNNQTIYYNVFNPEYTLVIEEEEEKLHSEFYSMVMINENQSYLNLSIKYFGTIIFQCQLTYLDGGRLLVPTPEWGFIRAIEKERFQGGYKYYLKDSYLYTILNFFYDNNDENERFAKSLLDEIIIYFNSKKQKNDFEQYVNQNKDLINIEIENEIKKLEHIKCSNESETKYVKNHIANGKVLKKHFIKFTEQKESIS